MSRQLVQRHPERRHRPLRRDLPSTPCFEFVAAEVYSSPLRKAIHEHGLPVVNGAVALPTRPGIGIELPADLLQRYRIA